MAPILRFPRSLIAGRFLVDHDRNVADFQPFGRRYEQSRIQCGERSAAERRHIVPVDRPTGMDLLDESLEFRLFALTPTILLERRLIDEAVPRVGHGRAVGEIGPERSPDRAGLAPSAAGRRYVGSAPAGPFELLSFEPRLGGYLRGGYGHALLPDVLEILGEMAHGAFRAVMPLQPPNIGLEHLRVKDAGYSGDLLAVLIETRCSRRQRGRPGALLVEPAGAGAAAVPPSLEGIIKRGFGVIRHVLNEKRSSLVVDRELQLGQL